MNFEPGEDIGEMTKRLQKVKRFETVQTDGKRAVLSCSCDDDGG